MGAGGGVLKVVVETIRNVTFQQSRSNCMLFLLDPLNGAPAHSTINNGVFFHKNIFIMKEP